MGAARTSRGGAPSPGNRGPRFDLFAVAVAALGAGSVMGRQRKSHPPRYGLGAHPKPVFGSDEDRALGSPMQPLLIPHPTDGLGFSLY